MQSLQQFDIDINNSINPLFTENNNILIALNNLISLANPKLENYDLLYNEYYTIFLKENKELILTINKHIKIELSLYSPFTFVTYSHLLLTVHYLKKNENVNINLEQLKNYDVTELIKTIQNGFGNIFTSKFQLIYSKLNNNDADEFYNSFKLLLNKMEYSLHLLKSEIDIKKPYLFDVNSDYSNSEIEILSNIKLLPDTILNIIYSMNDDFYRNIFKEFNEIVIFINQSPANIIAEVFYKMLKSNKFYLHNINKSKSIRQFLNHFGIEEITTEKIVKAMSNLNEDSIITTNKYVKNIENYFIKNEIKFQTFIEKK